MDEIIGGHGCGCQQKRSTADHIFQIHQEVEKKWEYEEALHELFRDFRKPMIQLEGKYEYFTIFS
jgi:hypothetical protein